MRIGTNRHRKIAVFALITCLFGMSPANAVEVVVGSGDTLYSIARSRLGDSRRWKEIAEWNNLQTPYLLAVGDTLILLPASETPQPETIVLSSAPDTTPSATEQAPHLVLGDQRPNFVPGFTEPLDQLLIALRNSNPSIRAAEESAKAATYRPSQAASLPDPWIRARIIRNQEQVGMVDPATNMVSFNNESMWEQGLGVSQMIPLGKLTPMANLERKMAGRMRELTGMEAATAERRMKTLYAELYYVDRSARTLTRIRDLMKLVLGSTEALYKVGEGNQADLLRAQLEISMIADRLIMLEGRRLASAEEINALLDRTVATPVGTPMSLTTYDLGAMSALDSSPAVRIARAEVEAAKAKVAIAHSMFIPDLELMGGIQNRPDLNPMWEVGIGVTLPIWSGTKQTPALKEAETELKAAKERLRSALASARQGVQTSLAMARTARSQSQLYGATIVPQARLTLEASLASYRVGSVDFMTVVGNLASVMEFEIAAHETVTNFYRAVAMAEEATGIPLPWSSTPDNQ